MSNYTSIYIYPSNQGYRPSKESLCKILEFFEVSIVDVASGSRFDGGDENEDVFFCRNIQLEELFTLIHKHNASQAHCCIKNDGFLRILSDSLANTIPLEISGGFLPWDTGITISFLEFGFFDSSETIDRGFICITKSANGCPPFLATYLEAFNSNPELLRLLEFLRLISGCAWVTAIRLT